MNNVEERIQQALAAGEFANLPGKGRPLKLDENPFEDPAWRVSNKILRNAGYCPPWIEKGRELKAEINQLREEWAQAYRTPGAAADRQTIHNRFKDRLERLNRQIRDHNLEAPSVHFHLALLGFSAEDKMALDRASAPEKVD